MSHLHQILFSLLLCPTTILFATLPMREPVYLPEYQIPYKTIPSTLASDDRIQEIELFFERTIKKEEDPESQDHGNHKENLTLHLNTKEYISMFFLSRAGSDINITARNIKEAMQKNGWRYKSMQRRLFSEKYHSEYAAHVKKNLDHIQASKEDL